MSRDKKTKFVDADAFIAGLPPTRRAAVEARAKQLIAEELTLRDLRKAREFTQVEIGAMLGIGQEHVSRLEQRSDMLLSTLASYVKAMGGTLKLVVEFPDRAPVTVSSLADVFDDTPHMRTTPPPQTTGPPSRPKRSLMRLKMRSRTAR